MVPEPDRTRSAPCTGRCTGRSTQWALTLRREESRRAAQDLIGSAQLTVLSLQDTDTLSVRGGRAGVVTGIDLNLADPASQRLGVDAELVAHPFEAASTRRGTFNASRRNRTVRSLSSSGYFLALAWSSCLPWNQALHHTQYNPVPDDLDTVPTSDADPLTPIPLRNPGCPARTRHERPASFAPFPLQEYHHYYESVHQHPPHAPSRH